MNVRTMRITCFVILLILLSLFTVMAGPPWSFTRTDQNHSLVIPADVIPALNGLACIDGDYIGVFYDSSGTAACGGYERWPGSGTAIAVSAWGSDATPPAKNGFAYGEIFRWKIWRHTDGRVFDVSAVYSMPGGIITDTSRFVPNGISSINSLTGWDVYTLSVTTVGEGSVVVTPDQTNYDSGSVVQLHAITAAMSHFASWTGDLSDTINPASVTMSANRSVTAIFVSDRVIIPLTIFKGWNMVSIPVDAANRWRDSLFPDASSRAFTYEGSYKAKDTLAVGRGYWIKYPNATMIPLRGVPVKTDTIQVTAGWNMVGSISEPVPAESVTTEPSGIKASNFFGYDGRYAVADTLQPGKAYWIKMGQVGKIILSKE
jgi:hypothetical protein